MNETTGAIKEWLNRSQNVVVASHVRPDGDAIGSQLALATRSEPPIGLGGPWKKARGRSLYRALGCGDGVAGVPVVVGAFSTVHVMALRSYLWPGAFFNASFVVFMTG